MRGNGQYVAVAVTVTDTSVARQSVVSDVYGVRLW